MWETLAAVGGSLLSNASSRSNNRWQKDWAKNRIRYTVEDARRAGVHPLFALGASTSGSPALIQDDYSAVPSAVGRDRNQKIAREIAASEVERNKAAATKDLAIAQATAAEQQRLMNAASNDAYQIFSDVVQNGGPSKAIRTDQGVVEVNPAETVTRQPGNVETEAGSQPFWTVVDTDAGKIRIPSQQVTEVLDSVGGMAITGYNLYKAGKAKKKAFAAWTNAQKAADRYREAARSSWNPAARRHNERQAAKWQEKANRAKARYQERYK